MHLQCNSSQCMHFIITILIIFFSVIYCFLVQVWFVTNKTELDMHHKNLCIQVALKGQVSQQIDTYLGYVKTEFRHGFLLSLPSRIKKVLTLTGNNSAKVDFKVLSHCPILLEFFTFVQMCYSEFKLSYITPKFYYID